MKFWDCAKVNMYVDNETEQKKIAATAAAKTAQRPFDEIRCVRIY